MIGPPVPERFQALLDEKGVSLKAIGIDDVGLRDEDAREGIRILREAGVIILGGDLYVMVGQSIEATDENWYVEPITNEDSGAFSMRSWTAAEAFIAMNAKRDDGCALFRLVMPTDRPIAVSGFDGPGPF